MAIKKDERKRSEEIAERIRQTLEERGMTQADLARALDVQPTTVWRYLEGRTGIDAKLVAIARALGVDAMWLEDGGEQRDDPQAREIEAFVREIGPTLRPPLTSEEERYVRATPHHRVTRGRLLDAITHLREGLTDEEIAGSVQKTEAARRKGEQLHVPARRKR